MTGTEAKPQTKGFNIWPIIVTFLTITLPFGYWMAGVFKAELWEPFKTIQSAFPSLREHVENLKTIAPILNDRVQSESHRITILQVENGVRDERIKLLSQRVDSLQAQLERLNSCGSHP